jgi:YggT family protein
MNLTSVIYQALEIYKIVLVGAVIMFWLLRMKIVDPGNEVARNIWSFLTRATEPVLAPIRRALPDFGGIDISPIIVIIAIQILQNILVS